MTIPTDKVAIGDWVWFPNKPGFYLVGQVEQVGGRRAVVRHPRPRGSKKEDETYSIEIERLTPLPREQLLITSGERPRRERPAPVPVPAPCARCGGSGTVPCPDCKEGPPCETQSDT